MDKKVLVVEDEPANRKLFRDLLQSKSYLVALACDGTEGIKLASMEKPSLILMDIGLPGISGLEATRIIKANPDTKNIPIVALTAYAMSEDREKAEKAGCDGFVSKPVDIKELLSVVAKYLSNNN